MSYWLDLKTKASFVFKHSGIWSLNLESMIDSVAPSKFPLWGSVSTAYDDNYKDHLLRLWNASLYSRNPPERTAITLLQVMQSVFARDREATEDRALGSTLQGVAHGRC